MITEQQTNDRGGEREIKAGVEDEKLLLESQCDQMIKWTKKRKCFTRPARSHCLKNIGRVLAGTQNTIHYSPNRAVVSVFTQMVNALSSRVDEARRKPEWAGPDAEQERGYNWV